MMFSLFLILKSASARNRGERKKSSIFLFFQPKTSEGESEDKTDVASTD